MIEPRLDILPNAQKEIWPSLVEVRDAFVLYGGTGLALRLGHRASVDFDFFSHDPLDNDRLFGLRLLDNAETLQRSEDTLTVSVPTQAGDRAKLSFFGGIDLGRVGRPDQTEDGVAWVASLLDLLAMKLAVLVQRISARDYVDIAAILQTGVPLADGLGAAAALYGRKFPPLDAVKALGYFDEGDAANVDEATRDVLRHHTGSWDGSVPRIAKASANLGCPLSSTGRPPPSPGRSSA